MYDDAYKNYNNPFTVIVNHKNNETVLHDIKYRTYHSRNYIIYFNIPPNLSKLDTFDLKVIVKNSGKVHNYCMVFDRKRDILLDNNCENNSDKNNINFVDYTVKHGLIRLKEKFVIIETYKMSIRWDKQGLKYIAIHY